MRYGFSWETVVPTRSNETAKMATSLEKPAQDEHEVAHIEKQLMEDGPLANPLLDKRLNRKFDLHILPWLFGIWYSSPTDSHRKPHPEELGN